MFRVDAASQQDSKLDALYAFDRGHKSERNLRRLPNGAGGCTAEGLHGALQAFAYQLLPGLYEDL